MRGTVSTLGRTAAVLGLLVGAAALSACGDANALSSMPASQLFGATNLTAAERQAYIRSLNWRLSVAVQVAGKGSRDKDEIIAELCECVVDNLQDRTTRLQFSMAIDMIKSGGFHSRPDFSSYRAVARAKGMDGSDFDQQAKETLRHISAAGHNCLSRFSGRG